MLKRFRFQARWVVWLVLMLPLFFGSVMPPQSYQNPNRAAYTFTEEDDLHQKAEPVAPQNALRLRLRYVENRFLRLVTRVREVAVPARSGFTPEQGAPPIRSAIARSLARRGPPAA